MTDLSELRFFQTAAHDCGYLADKQASNIFVDPQQQLSGSLYSTLSAFGFRRSGQHVYKPRCASCQACQPMRVLTELFTANRSQRRCMKRNEDLSCELRRDIDTDEHYELYARYIQARHRDGEMYPPKRDQFQEFLADAWGITRYLCFRDQQQKLLSVAVIDLLSDGISAMYSFFDPDEDKRSLGSFNVLFQILWARQHQLPHLYLGYLIKECRKMAYKAQYRPYQLLHDGHWRSYD
ncbi:arginyltransferase [Agaribacterium haliotis]|uniref:arginyltransferase n=1 Tax=Agaribacterium haliotis TaxID=2013869 RepID=UPI000BB582A2|nr:arginyltransferase [Agaribacterium haliotis]